MKNVVMSVLRDEMPLVSARSRFCTTARMRRPIGLTFSAVASAATHDHREHQDEDAGLGDHRAEDLHTAATATPARRR